MIIGVIVPSPAFKNPTQNTVTAIFCHFLVVSCFLYWFWRNIIIPSSNKNSKDHIFHSDHDQLYISIDRRDINVGEIKYKYWKFFGVNAENFSYQFS